MPFFFLLKFVGMVVHKVRHVNFVMHIDSISISKDQSYKYFLCLQFTINYNKFVFVPGSIRPGYKGLPGTNTLDYYKHTYLNYRCKKIFSIGPWGNIPNTLVLSKVRSEFKRTRITTAETDHWKRL